MALSSGFQSKNADLAFEKNSSIFRSYRWVLPWVEKRKKILEIFPVVFGSEGLL